MAAKTGTYTLIASNTVSNTPNTVTFSSIPSTYTDLVLVYNGSLNYTNTYYVMYFNGDTTLSNYSSTLVVGDGTSASSERNSYAKLGFSGSATVPVTTLVNIQDYSNTTTYKTAISGFANTNNQTNASVSLWRNTNAINSISIYSYYGGLFNNGSTFKLYGIEAGNL